MADWIADGEPGASVRAKLNTIPNDGTGFVETVELPPGGSAGQVLTKASDNNNVWQTPAIPAPPQVNGFVASGGGSAGDWTAKPPNSGADLILEPGESGNLILKYGSGYTSGVMGYIVIPNIPPAPPAAYTPGAIYADPVSHVLKIVP